MCSARAQKYALIKTNLVGLQSILFVSMGFLLNVLIENMKFIRKFVWNLCVGNALDVQRNLNLI